MLGSLKQRVIAGSLALAFTGAGALIAHEGFIKVGYVDPVGVPTACVGHTRTALVGKKYTEAECLALLKEDVKHAERSVKRLVSVRLTQDQFNALVSFTFNVGEGNLSKSTLLRKVNANKCHEAGAEFNRWVYAGGKKLPGLVKRRADESKMWLKGCKPVVISYTDVYMKHSLYSAIGLYNKYRRPEPTLEVIA